MTPFLHYLLQFFFAAMATIGFAHYFRAPKHMIPISGIVGGIGWVIYICLREVVESPLIYALIAALVVSLLGEILARLKKVPATVIVYSAITPMVPGAGIYYTMYALINKDYMSFIYHGSLTFMLAAGMALGIITAHLCLRIWMKLKAHTPT